MKRTLPLLVALLFLSSGSFAQSKGVFVSDAVVSVAQQAKVDYKGLVRKASAKDTKALADLFEFTRIVEGAALTDHVRTCLELIPLVGDEAYAKTLESRSAGLKAYLLKHMEAAQQKAQKEALKKPIGEWAPYTWEALNGREVNLAPKAAAGQPSPATAPDAAQLKSANDQQAPAQPGTLTPPAPDASKGNQLTPPGGRRGN